jgi:TP901 family phage tail tape measure protein
MADRVTKVELTAVVSKYVAGMKEAADATRKTTTEAAKLEKQGEAFEALGKGAVAFGTLAAVGVGLAVKRFADFDKQMSSVQASTQESAANMGLLRDAALEAGATTVFTATESAKAIEQLAKAGISTADVLGGGLKGSLDLAAAGEIEVGAAAEIAASALTQFNLAGSDVPHIADLLAAGAGKAQGGVDDLSAALNQSGLVASQMGLSLEETVGSLASFASAGLLGSDAGTSFRSMLLRLANPTDEAKQAMEDLGIAAYDAGGNFVGIESLAGQLQDRLGGLTQAQRDQTLALVFGQDAIRAANILYKEGSEGIAEWTEKVDDSGFAAEQAEARLDNLAGDVEKLGGAFDTALIKSGSAANEALRGLTQGITNLVEGFANAPQAVQTTGLLIGGLAAAVGLLGGAALLTIPKIAALRVSLIDLGVSAATADKAMAGAAVATKALGAAGVVAGIALVTKGFVDSSREALGLKETVDSIKKSLDGVGNGKTIDDLLGGRNLGELTDGGVFSDFLKGAEGAIGAAEDWNVALQLSGAEQTLMTEKLKTLDSTLADLVGSGSTEEAAALYEELASRTNGSKEALAKLDALLPQYAASQEGASEATADASTEVETFTVTAEEAKAATDDFVEALQGLGSEQLNLNEANRAVEQSLDDAASKLEEFKTGVYDAAIANGESEEAARAAADAAVAQGQALDITTEAGRQNLAALDGIAQAALNAAAATVEQTGSQEAAIPVIQRGRDAIIEAGIAAGLSADEASAYADELGLIPENVKTTIEANTATATSTISEYIRKLDAIPSVKTVLIRSEITGATVPGTSVFVKPNANGNMYDYQAFASGGFSSGIYSGRAGGIHKFAEPETRWEAYVSGKPGEEGRNRAILWEAGERLGMFGGGGGGAGNTTVSLAGARITLDVAGQEIVGVIREQAVAVVGAYEKQSSRASARGSYGF